METLESKNNLNYIELQINRGLFLSNKIILDNKTIEWGGNSCNLDEIESLRYGVTNVSVNGIPSGINYKIELKLFNNKKLKIAFHERYWFNKKRKIAAEINFNLIIEFLWMNFTSKLINNWLIDLYNNKSIQIGNFKLQKNGIEVTYSDYFIKKVELILWKDCLKSNENGYLVIQSSSNKNIKGMNMFLNTWNLNAFQILLNILWQDNNIVKLQSGVRIF